MTDETVVQMFAVKTGENESGPPKAQDPRYAQLLSQILDLIWERASESGGLSTVGIIGTLRLVEFEIMLRSSNAKSIGELLT